MNIRKSPPCRQRPDHRPAGSGIWPGSTRAVFWRYCAASLYGRKRTIKKRCGWRQSYRQRRPGTGLGIAIRQGNTELEQKFNAALEKVKKDGTYATIYAKWFQK
ncbi:transporter substrate-binding domain-containing protein [Escherichia coli]